jgi:glycosyltransferase involved in cell wall biosynthesis
LKSRLRVLFVVPSLRHGGAEMQVVHLVNGLDAAKFEPHLLYYDKGDALRGRVDTAKVRICRLHKTGRFGLPLASALARLIDERKIDVVHCTLQYSLFLAWMARISARSKPALVCAIHTTINRGLYEEMFDRVLYRRLFRACKALIFVCRSQCEHWLRKYPELESRAHVVFNGIDTKTFDPARSGNGAKIRESFGIPDDGRLVACVAAFRPEKGHDLLVTAFGKALEQCPQAYLLLAGDGPTRQSVERLVSELGLAPRVKFAGAIDDVRALLAASDATVLASTAVETFSMAMLESMAMGVPVVATDMGGTREAVWDGKTGLIVPPDDVPALARALVRLLGDDERRRTFGASARKLVLERFTEEQMIRETERILDIARPGKPRAQSA